MQTTNTTLPKLFTPNHIVTIIQKERGIHNKIIEMIPQMNQVQLYIHPNNQASLMVYLCAPHQSHVPLQPTSSAMSLRMVMCDL
jgi:hypothetical protein